MYILNAPDSASDAYTWWDYRAGNCYDNVGMRIDHLLVTTPLARRVVWAKIDREKVVDFSVAWNCQGLTGGTIHIHPVIAALAKELNAVAFKVADQIDPLH